MKTFRETAIIPASAVDIWQFLTPTTHGSYLAWHPRDHLDFKVTRASSDETGIGQKVYYEERLGSRAHKLHCVITQSVPGSYVEFKPTGLPGLLGLGSGYFRLNSVSPRETQLEAVVELGWRLPILDPFIGYFLDVAALREHMRQEGEYLPDAVKA